MFGRKKIRNINYTLKFFFNASDLANRDSEIQKLGGEAVHVKEMLQRQTIEKEQLTQQVNTLHQNNHAEENKIEIRNLQNALDSSKKEIESQRALGNDYKIRIEDLTKQVADAKQLTQKSNDNFLVISQLSYKILQKLSSLYYS